MTMDTYTVQLENGNWAWVDCEGHVLEQLSLELEPQAPPIPDPPVLIPEPA